MRRSIVLTALALAVSACASKSAPPTDVDASAPVPDASAPLPDAGDPNACAVFGAPGDCMTTSACTALGLHTSYAGYCAGPADIQCCIVTPDPKNNPPIPAGYRRMKDAEVTPPMTTWAVTILHDPVKYPMFSTTTMMFGVQLVLARVEWHVPDFQNSAIHRGVTLYLPL
jgi:hypothetical protein